MGRVQGAHGVRGALMVASFSDPPRRLLQYSPWWLLGGDAPQPLAVVRGQDSTKGLIVEVEGIADREAAAALRGREIAVERAALPPLRKGEYYWADLEGLAVRNRDGADFGRVDHLVDFGAHPILVVRDGARERMIPFVLERHVISVDLDVGVIKVDWDPDF
ncbi:MAG: 16S rRNA processing protein RimM [Xanthomonadales bacterium]|nr:Ribosome maturation factor RimM [Xanthomonadales bacterium]MCC6594279.1 16S rRNA processing protein RimM [Xanthomonadales bacterium]MCE7930858.1 16S rRNA processing protein RimM [Xanthomonadales bacterium PRO6]